MNKKYFNILKQRLFEDQRQFYHTPTNERDWSPTSTLENGRWRDRYDPKVQADTEQMMKNYPHNLYASDKESGQLLFSPDPRNENAPRLAGSPRRYPYNPDRPPYEWEDQRDMDEKYDKLKLDDLQNYGFSPRELSPGQNIALGVSAVSPFTWLLGKALQVPGINKIPGANIAGKIISNISDSAERTVLPWTFGDDVALAYRNVQGPSMNQLNDMARAARDHWWPVVPLATKTAARVIASKARAALPYVAATLPYAGTALAGVAIGTAGAYGINKGIDYWTGARKGEGLADRQFEWDTYNPVKIWQGGIAVVNPPPDPNRPVPKHRPPELGPPYRKPHPDLMFGKVQESYKDRARKYLQQ